MSVWTMCFTLFQHHREPRLLYSDKRWPARRPQQRTSSITTGRRQRCTAGRRREPSISRVPAHPLQRASRAPAEQGRWHGQPWRNLHQKCHSDSMDWLEKCRSFRCSLHWIIIPCSVICNVKWSVKDVHICMCVNKGGNIETCDINLHWWINVKDVQCHK